LEKILVCDWLDQYGGAERVIRDIYEILKPDRIYTMVNVMNRDDLELMGLAYAKIEQTFLKCLGKKFRYALPLFPLAVRSISRKLPCNCLIVSSSHCVAKGVTSKASLHICYLQARNMKYIWDEKDRYMRGVKKIGNLFMPYLRRYDLRSAQAPDYLVANSQYVADWIYSKYGRRSTVIYPPVEIDRFCPQEVKDDYFVYAGRLEPYKRVDLIIRAFNDFNKRLIIVGEGSQRKYLESIAVGQVEFLGYQPPDIVASLLARAKAFVMANEEDFGIAPVEAQACGTPVIAYAKGGVLETVVDGKTGLLFSEQTVEGLKQALTKFIKIEQSFDTTVIRKQAEKFSAHVFKNKFSNFIEEKIKESHFSHG
jgi:glycosyltransferase involved in cell wall biosynthesis